MLETPQKPSQIYADRIKSAAECEDRWLRDHLIRMLVIDAYYDGSMRGMDEMQAVLKTPRAA